MKRFKILEPTMKTF